MPTEDLFEIDIDVTEAVKALDTLDRKLEETGDAAEEAGEQANDAGGGWDAMADGAKKAGVGLAAAAAALGVVIAAVVKFGNELERQAGIINRFAGNIDNARDRLNGLVSDLDLMLASNKLAQAGLSATAEEFGAIAVAASEAAARLGTDFEAEMSKITQALATGGVDALREYGVVIELSGDKAIDSARAMAEFARKMDGVEASADTVGGQIQVLTVALENAETAALDMVNTSSTLTTAFSGLLEALDLTTGDTGSGLTAFDYAIAHATAMATVFIEQLTRTIRVLGQLANFDFADAVEGVAQIMGTDVVGDIDARTAQNILDARIEGLDRLRESTAAAAEAEQERRRKAAPGSGGGGGAGPGASISESRNETLDSLGEIAAAILELNATWDESERERLEATKLATEARTRAELDAIAKTSAAQIEAKQNEAAVRDKIAKNEEASSKAQVALASDVTGATIAAGEQIMAAAGATQGQMELWRGIADVAQAVTSFASQNYASGALFLVSSGLHFANAAQMGVGGGGGGQGAAAKAAAAPRPTAAPGGGSGGSGGGTVVVNFNAPTAQPLIGRDLLRAEATARQRFGGGGK